MRINISNDLYNTNHIKLERVNYIFGRNGTGKSTLTKIIKAQCAPEYDVRVFQGFDSIIGRDDLLNAVVLGQENASIKEQIDDLQKDIRMYQSAQKDIEKEITSGESTGPDSLGNQRLRLKGEEAREEKKLDKFYTSAARTIKMQRNPSISITTYNKKHFMNDIAYAACLSENERQQYINTLLSEVKIAPDITFPVFDYRELLQNANDILQKKVEEKIIVARLEGDPAKQKFAQAGLHLHKPGDICAFCGSIISENAYEELGSYFSADETKALQIEIDNFIKKLQDYRKYIQDIHMDSNLFYPEYVEKINNLSRIYSETVIQYIKFFETLIEALENKKSHLFVSMEPIAYEDEIRKISDFDFAYSDYRAKNNSADLDKKQKLAMNALRFDAVKKALDDNSYDNTMESIGKIKVKIDAIEKEIEKKKEEIDDLESEIRECNKKINELLKKTKNEHLLAININKKLRSRVGFELEHYEGLDHKGYYHIKDLRTGTPRPVTQLSTGEQNVIAFLYFIEKLNEIQDSYETKSKMIIVDDPMNSNDETMQYLIIDELQQLVRSIEKEKKDNIVILTHNIRCYLGLCNFYSDKEYITHNVLHLEKNNYQTSVRRIESKKEDFTTTYGRLWRDLIYLYNDENSNADLMLNPMRRIIESYTKFNGRNWNKFCSAANIPLAMFHANSHAVVDMGSQSNVYSKQELVKMFYECFDANRVASHVKYYWPGIEDIIYS